jgi:hypothetical protein
MFIDATAERVALRSGGRCQAVEHRRVREYIALLAEGGACLVTDSINIALLAEGGASRHGFYKHCPPGGGRRVSSRIL